MQDGEVVYSEEERGDYEEVLRPYFGSDSDVNENLRGRWVSSIMGSHMTSQSHEKHHLLRRI